MSGRRHPPVLVAVLAAVAGGLLLAGGAAGEWVSVTETRTVGGVEVREEHATGGTEFAAAAIPLGFAAALGGVALAVVRGPLRRLAGAGLVVAGAAGVAVVGVGLARAAGHPGTLGPAVGLGAAGGLVVVAAGVLALRRPRAPVLGDRYAVEGDPGDDEWRLASAERPERS